MRQNALGHLLKPETSTLQIKKKKKENEPQIISCEAEVRSNLKIQRHEGTPFISTPLHPR